MRYVLILLVAITLGGCNKGKQSPVGQAQVSLSKDVVAKINGKPITLKQFNERYEWYVDRFKFRITKKEFLKNLIRLELSAHEALRRGLDKDKRVQYDWKVLLSQHVIEKDVYAKFKDVKVSNKELKQHFKSSPEIRASHILFKLDPDAKDAEVEKVKKKAQKILKLAKAKGDFAALAKKHSEGPSGRNGGDLDFFSRDSMVPEFSTAAFNLKKMGDISDLVRTKYGYHVIKLTGRRKFKDADKRRLRSQLRSKKQREIYDKYFEDLKKNASIVTNDKLVEE